MDPDEAVSRLLSQGSGPYEAVRPRPLDLLLVSLFRYRLFHRCVVELEGTWVWFGGVLDRLAFVDLGRFAAVKVLF
jgi:hypothetical protein